MLKQIMLPHSHLWTVRVTLLITATLILLLPGCQSTAYRGPISDHFDGRTFYYSTDKNRIHYPTLDLISVGFVTVMHPWPKPLPNPSYYDTSRYYSSGKIKVTFINHATTLVQTPQMNFLLDPVFSYRVSPFKWIGPARVKPPGIDFKDLPKIDVVMISHNHYDHMDEATLKDLDQTFHPLFIVPLGNKTLMNHFGITNVIEMDWWQMIHYKQANISFLPARHNARRGLFDFDRSLWGSYGIEVAKKRIYFAGDTGYADHFKAIRKRWGRPDFSLIPIGAYQPRQILKFYHLNPQDAVKVHLDLDSRVSMGVHWGAFQLSAESYLQPIEDLNMARKHANVEEKAFFVAKEGKPFYLK